MLKPATSGPIVSNRRMSANANQRNGLNPGQKERGHIKASALLGVGWENDPVDVLWRDAGHVFCGLCRHNAEGEQHTFIPVPVTAEHPTLESVDRFAHEHDLKNYLDRTWALRPLELVR
jgi:hypothetical protein